MLWFAALNVILISLFIAVNMANPGSCVFFFTDADAKDPERADELIHLVNEKNMRILYLLRDECHRRRRRTSHFNVPENVQCIKNNIIRRAG